MSFTEELGILLFEMQQACHQLFIANEAHLIEIISLAIIAIFHTLNIQRRPRWLHHQRPRLGNDISPTRILWM